MNRHPIIVRRVSNIAYENLKIQHSKLHFFNWKLKTWCKPWHWFLSSLVVHDRIWFPLFKITQLVENRNEMNYPCFSAKPVRQYHWFFRKQRGPRIISSTLGSCNIFLSLHGIAFGFGAPCGRGGVGGCTTPGKHNT